MKQFAVLLVSVFAAVLNVHSVSTVSAGCWQGDSECSWFQGGEELKRAKCFIEECEEADEKRRFTVRFAGDEETERGIVGQCKAASADKEEGECTYTLNNQEAQRMDKTFRAGWTCYTQSSAEERMCVKDDD